MSVFHAAILGIVQGLTEFLPVSSSGHLVIFPNLLGWKEQPLVFDTTLHLGTAAALAVYFWNDLWNIVKQRNTNLILAIIIGVIPAGILGFLFDNQIEQTFRSVWYVALFLLLGTGLMLVAELMYKSYSQAVTPFKGFIIGIFQSLALLPGVSRSGATISGGMLSGINREEAARFSFLLSLPIVLLAGIYKLFSSFPAASDTIAWPVISAGFVASFVSGMLAIHLLLNFVRRHSLYIFIVYRLLLAGFLLLVFL
ncbi:MAG TPA: undecaprenyl-diphosphatase UppP [Patescibacteria group bacterium]|nr:undecaprenyl-diphosphatase UppP [Patescibacteria group bacterium]